MTCPFDPTPLINIPLGMFHCPECGEMVVAGVAHPDYSILDHLEAKDLLELDDIEDVLALSTLDIY